MFHSFSPSRRATNYDKHPLALFMRPLMFMPIAVVVVCLAWMVVQSMHDYHDVKYKAGERVGIAAHLVADHLTDMMRATRQAASIVLLERSSRTDEQWRNQGADELRRLRPLLQRTLPGIEIGVYDMGNATLQNSDPVFYNAFSMPFVRQRSELLKNHKSVLIHFVPSGSMSGIFLISQSYRNAIGAVLYIVQLIMHSDAVARILQNSLFVRDADLIYNPH
jgi:hypothetical protein